jgi:hypothetical protein
MNKFLLFITLIVLVVNAEVIEIRSCVDKFYEFNYETPDGNKIEIPKQTTLIIATFEKDMGVLVNEYLQSQNQAYLLKHNLVFIADLSTIPAFFRKMFILPKFKKYRHHIYMTFNSKFKKTVPNEEGKVTFFRIENAKIADISYVSTRKELKAAIEK